MSNPKYTVYCIRPKLPAYPPADCYFGATRIPLSIRFSLHRSAHKKGSNASMSRVLFDKYGGDSLEIVALDRDLTQFEARQRESLYMKRFPCVNVNKNHITDYEQYNKEYQRAYRPLYYDENRDHLLELSRRKVECSCGALVRRYYLEKHQLTGLHDRRYAANKMSAMCIGCSDDELPRNEERERPDSVPSPQCGIQT